MTHSVIDIIVKQSPHLNWIADGTCLLVRHGSHAYGTNTESSDEDFKGITIPPSRYFLGYLQRFEQAELKDPDAVIYDIRKFFHLAADCNPNIIEVLHTDPSDHCMVSPIGEIILDHKNEFLSKKAKHTFSGYAISQLHRIQSHKRWIMNPPQTPPTRKELGLPEQTLIPADQLAAAEAAVKKELDAMSFDFMDSLQDSTKIEIKNAMAKYLSELKITADEQFAAMARKIGFNDNFIEVMVQERKYSQLKREFDQYQNWKQTRNRKRFELEEKFGYDCKHAYHLVRLLRMCKEMLLTGKVIVKRPDREELLAIRNGAWTYDQLIEYAKTEEKLLDELYLTTQVLPKTPNQIKLDKLCVDLIEQHLFYARN